MCQISLGAEIGHSTPEAVNFTNSGNIFTMYGPIMCAILNEICRIYDAFTFVIWPVLLNSCRSCGPFTSTGVFPQNFQEPLCSRKNIRVVGRPLVKRFALCYRTVVLFVCPVCPVLSVTLVYCGQTVGVGPIKMKLATQVGLGTGHIMLCKFALT